MALGKRKIQQSELFIATRELAHGPGHPFYCKLNEVLATAEFDQFVERLCATKKVVDPVFRRASTFGCCLSATSRAWTASGASPGAVPTVWPCALSSEWP